MVNRHIEESLDLVGMEVHGNQAVDACCTQQVGYKFCGNRHAGFVLAILTGPAEVGHHSGNRLGRCPLGCINHEQELHKVVAVRECGLDKVNLGAADGFLERYFELPIGKVLDVHLAKLYAQIMGYFLGNITRFST